MLGGQLPWRPGAPLDGKKKKKKKRPNEVVCQAALACGQQLPAGDRDPTSWRMDVAGGHVRRGLDRKPKLTWAEGSLGNEHDAGVPARPAVGKQDFGQASNAGSIKFLSHRRQTQDQANLRTVRFLLGPIPRRLTSQRAPRAGRAQFALGCRARARPAMKRSGGKAERLRQYVQGA